MAPKRKTGTARRGPEYDDPEAANVTLPKSKLPLPAADDPERDKKTGRISAPAPKRASPTRTAVPSAEGDDGGYSTDQSFQAMQEEALEGEDAPSISLAGDGLDALDPELAPQVKHASGEDQADDPTATRSSPPFTVEIVGGPDAGTKKRFNGVRMVIGRTPGVDLQLSDQSVSRRHIELIHSDEGTLLRDLGSGNGTRLNGEKISADTMLKNGDEIRIGKTKLKFVDELAAFRKAADDLEKQDAASNEAADEEKPEADEAEAASEAEAAVEGEDTEDEAADKSEGEEEAAGEEEGEQKKGATRAGDRLKPLRTSPRVPAAKGLGARFAALNPKVRFGIIGGAVVLVVALVVGLATRKPPPSIDPAQEQAANAMQQARTAVRDGRFEEAVKLVDEAEKLSPGIDKTRLGVQAREAVAIQGNFDQVKKHITERRFEDAKKLLADTPKGTTKNEADRLKLEQELKDALIAFHREKVAEFLAAGELDSAQQTLALIPVEQAGDLRSQLEEFERTVAESQKQDERDARIASANAAAAKKAKREEELAIAFAVVERKFAGGEWARAASECSRVIDSFAGDKEITARASALAASIPNFGRNFDEGMKKFRLGQLIQAARPLRMASQSYRAMGLTHNRYGEELSQALLKAALSAGKQALIREDLDTAMANFREARRIDNDDPEARKGFELVAEKAEELYQVAYNVKDREPREALRKFKTVIAVTEAGTPVHEKAKNQVAAMAP
jgi:pSer/pThr/pTyr-binding forkhead associated (FHA) protein